MRKFWDRSSEFDDFEEDEFLDDFDLKDEKNEKDLFDELEEEMAAPSFFWFTALPLFVAAAICAQIWYSQKTIPQMHLSAALNPDEKGMQSVGVTGPALILPGICAAYKIQLEKDLGTPVVARVDSVTGGSVFVDARCTIPLHEIPITGVQNFYLKAAKASTSPSVKLTLIDHPDNRGDETYERKIAYLGPKP